MAVVGLADPLFGEKVAACVQLSQGEPADAAELRALCEQNLVPFKVPVRWDFVDEMPRTPLGKIQKFLLQRALLEKDEATDRR